MTFLRDVWRRGPVHRYFADMAPIDRATALIVMALALAIGVSFNKILHSSEATFDDPPPAYSVPA